MTIIVVALILILGFSTLDAKQFLSGFVISFMRVAFSYVIALFLAVVLTLVVTSSTLLERISIPVLDVLQSFPSFALYPLFVIWFGKNSSVTIFILIAEMIWPILFSLLAAKKQIKQELVEAASSFGATGFKFINHVLFPLLFPAIVTGSIIAWGEAWEAIIAAEIIVNVPGVGTYLARLGNQGTTSILVVGIFLLLTLLFVINKFLWLSLLNISTKYQQE